MNRARNARTEAAELLPAGHEARVLEPSPPANTDPAWYADDATDPSGATGTVVTPIPGEGRTWTDFAAGDPVAARYAHDHWLDGRRRLRPLPDHYDSTRRALHQIAFYAMAPARHRVTGKLGLRYTHRGFGTPFFGDDEQIRVEDGVLVREVRQRISTHEIRTLEAATAFLDIEYRHVWFEGFRDPLVPIGPHAEMAIEGDAARAMGEWFGFATHVLERARRTPGAVDVSRVQLWPEHFDPAFEMGSQEAGARASYGGSPGDDAHPEPYLYVAAWGQIDRSDAFWNDSSFNGASLAYRELLESPDPYATALDFLHEGHRRLAG